jgi:AcrR family transcriptional regulator
MPPRSTTADSLARAARRIFELEGAAAVTTRRVAALIGLTPMAIYRHYPNRHALLNRVADDAFEELVAHWTARRARGGTRARIMALLDGYLDYALAHPRVFDFLFSENRTGARRFPQDFRARRSPTANLLADAIAEGMKTRELRHDDLWEVTLAVWAHAHGLIVLYRAGRFDLSPAAFRALYRRSARRLFDGLEA